MAIRMNIKVEGVKEVNAMLESKNRGITNSLEGAIRASLNVLQVSARRKVPVDTGALRRSITKKLDWTGSSLRGIVGPTEPYGICVEKGTKPHFPPVGALRGWAGKRGINPYALAVAISRGGTEAQPYMEPTFEQKKDYVDRIIKTAVQRAISIE